MKSRRSAILLATLGAFCCVGVALGQAPREVLQREEAPDDQRANASGPVAAHNAADFEPRGSPRSATPRNPLWAIPLDSLRHAREHPLFSASRRPPAPIVAAAPNAGAPAPTPTLPAAPEKPQVTLVGTVRSADVQMGVFLDETDQSPLRMRVGQSVRGWTVHGVDPRAATLEKAEHDVTLELPARDAETAAATPPAMEETALPPPGPSGPIHGTPVGRIKPFATAERYK
jgi:hypothetical protein